MNIILLTHQRELEKKSNTGSLVLSELKARAKLIVWERKKPSSTLLTLIANEPTALLYPVEHSQPAAASDPYQHYIIIDGTWQEAQKIYNRSPYLHSLPAVSVQSDQPSLYHLRRNQRVGGLCTAECAIELLIARECAKSAEQLTQRFLQYLQGAK